MSRSAKSEKRRRGVAVKGRSEKQGSLILKRHNFGHTEKIRRRNRKLWRRLYAKEGRQLDKQAIKDSAE